MPFAALIAALQLETLERREKLEALEKVQVYKYIGVEVLVVYVGNPL